MFACFGHASISFCSGRLEQHVQPENTLFSIKCAHTVLCYTFKRLKIYKRLLALTFDSLADSFASRLDAYFEGIWTHIKTIATRSSALVSSTRIMGNLRVVEYVDGNRLSAFV